MHNGLEPRCELSSPKFKRTFTSADCDMRSQIKFIHTLALALPIQMFPLNSIESNPLFCPCNSNSRITYCVCVCDKRERAFFLLSWLCLYGNRLEYAFNRIYSGFGGSWQHTLLPHVCVSVCECEHSFFFTLSLVSFTFGFWYVFLCRWNNNDNRT